METPRHIIFFDTETYEEKGKDETQLKFKLGCACYYRTDIQREEWFDFHTKREFWNWVFGKLKKNTTIYLVAHNLPFDFRVLEGFYEMNRFHMKQVKLIYDGTMNIFKFKKDGYKNIVCLDNMNFFKVPLKVLGENVGVEKMDIKTSDLMTYCRNDVKILVTAWKIYLLFLSENNLGNFSPTIAGQAFNSFRHRFMKERIFIHNNASAIKIEREAYHGGRTECFAIGKQKRKMYYLYDVNSMYPSVMKTNEYPVKFLNRIHSPSLSQMKILLRDKCVIAECLLCTHEHVFPLRNKEGKLIFPTGRFRTVLTTREIEYGLKHKAILKFGSVLVYRRKKIFSEYVDFFYEKKNEYKKNRNESFYYICKLFMNSLYGKFGQRNKQYEPSDLELPEDGLFIDADTGKNYRVINGKTEVLTGMKEGYDSMVSIPAHVTADARMKLWELFKQSGRVYYCDTDSVITDKVMPTSTKLGGISLKDKSSHLVLFGNKDYEFAHDIVMKGIKKNALKIAEGIYEQTQFEGMAGAISKNRINSMFIKQTIKHLYRNYEKGTVLSTGKVVPFELDMV